jgi:hypothetical protein
MINEVEKKDRDDKPEGDNGDDNKKLFVFVDGEKYFPPSKDMTPRDIISGATDLDVNQHYLVQVRGNQQTSYQGQPEQIIHLEKGMKFLVLFEGAMTVSDAQIPIVGTKCFADGLTDLGYAVCSLPDHPDMVYFEYEVPVGCFAGETVMLGFQVPPDFPMTAPSGPHTSPCLRPSDQPGEHPNGGRHTSHAQPFANALGGSWQYWSRPCNDWNNTNRSVKSYMSFIATLWATQ